MPIARVQINGRVARIEVPAGTTPEQAQQMAMRTLAPQPAQPRAKPTSFLQGLAEGIAPAARNLDNLTDALNPAMWAAKGIAALTGSHVPSGSEVYASRQKAFSRSPNRGSAAGRITGGIAASLPALLVPGGAAVQGAASGLLTSNATNAGGFARDAVIGAVTGKIGDKVVGGLSRAASPRVAPVVQRLKDRGIPLTVGQIAGANGGVVGRTVRGIENKLTSVPGVGNAISQAYQRGQTGLNRAAFDEGLAPIRARVPGIGEAGIEQAKNAVSQGYDNALGHVRIAPDQQFAADLTAAGQSGQVPGNFTDDFNRIMRDEVGPSMTQPQLAGKDIQDLLRITKGYGRQYGKLATTGANGIPQPSARPVAGAFKDLSQAVEDMVGRQAPDVMPAYGAANEAYRNVGVLRDAVNAAKVGGGGEFTAAQLSQAARANAKKFGGTHGTTDQPFFDLTRDAQEVMPSTVPNSGTADRGLVGLLLGGTVGLPAVAASGLASIPYTQAGQKVMQGLLTGRQGPAFKTLAQVLEELRPLGVGAGAAGGSLLFGPN